MKNIILLSLLVPLLIQAETEENLLASGQLLSVVSSAELAKKNWQAEKIEKVFKKRVSFLCEKIGKKYKRDVGGDLDTVRVLQERGYHALDWQDLSSPSIDFPLKPYQNQQAWFTHTEKKAFGIGALGFPLWYASQVGLAAIGSADSLASLLLNCVPTAMAYGGGFGFIVVVYGGCRIAHRLCPNGIDDEEAPVAYAWPIVLRELWCE